jgi:2-keto-3-deoxy-L-rhamnonate aldolase RhmA
LAGSIGELGHVYGERTTRLIDEAVAILRAAGKPFGVSTGFTDREILQYWHDKGYRRRGFVNELKKKLHQRFSLAGTHVTMNDPCISELIGNVSRSGSGSIFSS